MDEAQLKELYALLDMFKKKYPDHSPEEVKAIMAEALEALADTPPMTDTDRIERESCKLFNTGRFNDVVLAYVVLSLNAAGTAQDAAMNILDTLYHSFDRFTAEEALTRYRNSFPSA